MRLLVSGGAGFIGSHLVDRLVADGHTVWAVDDLSTGRLANLASALESEHCHFVEMDVASPDLVGLVAEAHPDVVLHLAAQMDVRKSVAAPLHDTRVNVLGTVNLLTAAVRAGARKLVFASSGGTVYGEPDSLPVSEDAPLRPASPYGAAKVAGETYVAAFGRLHGIAWTSLRLANVYGPRQDPHGEAGVIAIFGRAMLAGRKTVVFGDGTSSRDYVYVDDVVDAFVRSVVESSDGQIYNVGTGQPTGIRALHSLVAAATGVADDPTFEPERLGELQHIALNPARLTATTGWTASTELKAGLDRTVAWIASASAHGAAV
jgi:UDP-glucose 4-epimerase